MDRVLLGLGNEGRFPGRADAFSDDKTHMRIGRLMGEVSGVRYGEREERCQVWNCCGHSRQCSFFQGG